VVGYATLDVTETLKAVRRWPDHFMRQDRIANKAGRPSQGYHTAFIFPDSKIG
jgi:hypothetical protein